MKTRSDVLVDAAWLDAHLYDPAVRVVEVDVSRRAHDEWHIEGRPGLRRLVGRMGPDARCPGRTALTA
jgi:hypothetical protein